MTEEEYFRKTYPDYCYGNRLLSPHWDFFQDGVEFGERQSEKKIAELEKENAELKKANATLGTMNKDMWAELEKKRAESQGITSRLYQLAQAKEIIKLFVQMEYNDFTNGDYSNELSKVLKQAEQFLKQE